ncbi:MULTISPECIES: hypothetical protein [Burkholderia]|nr:MULTISPECIES: hypothetical protein [Burkholderia]
MQASVDSEPACSHSLSIAVRKIAGTVVASGDGVCARCRPGVAIPAPS